MHTRNDCGIDEINKSTMREAVRDYAVINTLSPPEAAALGACADEVRGGPILDLGVGAGRTVEPLNRISTDYIGIDYVEEMVVFCRKRYPEVRFKHADARSLTGFPNNSYALVMFGCNGISMVDHAGRLAILKEVFRLLMPGGYFIFSTYNRDDPRHKRFFQFPDFSYTHNPAKLAIRLLRFCVHTAERAVNRIRFKSHEQEHLEYDIINDVCHNYATMLYYISLNDQRKQLEEAGFLPGATAYDLAGHEVTSATLDDSLIYKARKPC
jgi:ubiquinone/menaquinone biosynthesis C-methylase UbiE